MIVSAKAMTPFSKNAALKKIVLTGPESSGKTSLAQKLALHYRSDWVPEFARHYLENLNRPYQKSDLLKIAEAQIETENMRTATPVRFLFCDTDLITIKIWSEYRFGDCDPWILKQIEERTYHHYLLCKPDIAWQPDPLRENPDDREALYLRYKSELIFYKKSFSEIGGVEASLRFQRALAALAAV